MCRSCRMFPSLCVSNHDVNFRCRMYCIYRNCHHEGKGRTVQKFMRRGPKFIARQILGTPLRRYTYHSQSIRQPPARWFTPNVMDHRVWPSTQASQILKLPRIGAVQDHSGHPGTSQPLTPQPPSWKATSQDPADTEPIHTNIQLVGPLTISQNQTIFEISIRTTSIGNF